jgi:hypothetical protein
MEKNRIKFSSLFTLGSMLLFAMLLLVNQGYASASSTAPAFVTNAVSAATCSGNIVEASISGGTVTFTNKFQKDMEVGVAVYKVFDSNIDTQELFDSKTGTVPACGTLTLTVSLSVPLCNYQLDAFLGSVLKSMNGQRYGSRLITAKDPGSSDFCTNPGQAVGDVVQKPVTQPASGQNSSPEAVLDVVQIPSGLPQTGFGNTGNDNSANWLFIGLVLLLGSSITAIVLYRRKLLK